MLRDSDGAMIRHYCFADITLHYTYMIRRALLRLRPLIRHTLLIRYASVVIDTIRAYAIAIITMSLRYYAYDHIEIHEGDKKPPPYHITPLLIATPYAIEERYAAR